MKKELMTGVSNNLPLDLADNLKPEIKFGLPKKFKQKNQEQMLKVLNSVVNIDNRIKNATQEEKEQLLKEREKLVKEMSNN